MKKITLFCAAILLHAAIFAQSIEFFTADWKKTKKKDKASFYRSITYGPNGQPTGPVTDYYMTGQVQWRGLISSIDRDGIETRQGWCTWYYTNGQYRQQSFYIQGKLDSTTYYWNENGDLTGEEDYRNNLLHGAWIRYFPNKKPRLVAAYRNGRLEGDVYLEYDENAIPTAVFPEYFDDVAKWTLFNGTDYTAALKDRKLWLSSTTGNFRAFGYKHLPLNTKNNFSLEAMVTVDKRGNGSGSHGLIWGAKDQSNYDYFIISDNGYFQIGCVQKGIDIKSVAWTRSAAIKPAKSPNQLKVLRMGDKYLFAINGQAVATAPFQPLMGENAGVTLASGIENISFDRFIAQQETAISGEQYSPEDSETSEWNVSGSGILIDKNGFIATNQHVIDGAKKIEVEFTKDNKKYAFNAEVIKADTTQDLAILKINDPRYNAFKPASLPYGITGNLLDIGSGVFALGYPEIVKLGTNIKFTDGKISAQSGTQDNPNWYQITVPIQHGNSGGPLFDNDGNLVGLTNAGFFGTMQNVAYAIKSALLIKFVATGLPSKYNAPANTLKTKPLTEKIKILKSYVALIKAKI